MIQLFRRLRGEEGSVLVSFMLVVPVLLGLLAVAFDGGTAYVEQRQAQNGVDAAALATTQFLANSWTEGGVSASDSQVRGIASYFLGQNAGIASGTSFTLDYLDQNGNVIATSPTTVPANARGVHLVNTAVKPSLFARFLGVDVLQAQSQGAAKFGPAGSANQTFPLAVDNGLAPDSSHLQPAGGVGGGQYVNVAFINTNAFGSGQDFFDALKNGVRDPIQVGSRYPTTTADWVRWRSSVVSILQDRITRGRARGDTSQHFSADSPQLLIVATVNGGFNDAGSPIQVYSFRAFFLEDVDPNGNWAQGEFVSGPVPRGTISYSVPATGVFALRLIQ